MNRTKIEWVKNPDGTQGYTWNPITGCLNGYEYCYARKLANTRLRERYLANHNVAGFPDCNKFVAFNDPFYPRFWEDRLSDYGLGLCEPYPKKKRGIFTCDMSDLFGIGIPEEWTKMVLNVIQSAFMHRFYLLTKQPQNLLKFSPFPPNCWVGVSATTTKMFHNACFYLSEIDAPVKYISVEPFLEWEDDGYQQRRLEEAGVKQVIIGSQTKPLKHPKAEWIKEIVDATDKAGIPVFLKDTIAGAVHPDMDWAWRGTRLRQEMPLTHKKELREDEQK